MSEEGMRLKDVLSELHAFALKYKFNLEDYSVFVDRIIMFGVAVSMLEELGLSSELEVRHEKSCVEAMGTLL